MGLDASLSKSSKNSNDSCWWALMFSNLVKKIYYQEIKWNLIVCVHTNDTQIHIGQWFWRYYYREDDGDNLLQGAHKSFICKVDQMADDQLITINCDWVIAIHVLLWIEDKL